MSKNNIFFAIGNRDFEEYLQGVLQDRYKFVGETTYREGILLGIEKNNPDVVIIRESLPGNKPIMEILYEIRDRFPEVRIIFMANEREVGDMFLATLVNYGIYDFISKATTNVRDVIKLIEIPNKFEDVKRYLPRPEEDERGRMVFKAPEIQPEVVIKEVVINEDPKPKKSLFGGFGGIAHAFKRGKESENVTPAPTQKKAQEPIPEPVVVSKKEPERVVREKTPIFQRSVQKTKEVEPVRTNNRILTFISGKSGAGSSSVSINTAYKLADMGYKVIYLEFNSLYPSVLYWLDLGKAEEGIDTCLEYLRNFEFQNIGKTIIKSSVIKEENGPMKKRYKSLPNTLDFMFFSRAYISGVKERVSMKESKELYVHLMFQLGYDFIVLDVPSDINLDESLNGLIFCNKIYSVLTQDVSSIGYYLMKLYELREKGIELRDKNTFVVNRFIEGTNVGEKYIKDWIGETNIITVPRDDELFINSNAEGLIALSVKGHSSIDASINKIVRDILN